MDELFEEGLALIGSCPDEERIPVIIEGKESLAALGQVLFVTMSSGVLRTLGETINFINVILETCYYLGYQAGGEVKLDEVWYEED